MQKWIFRTFLKYLKMSEIVQFHNQIALTVLILVWSMLMTVQVGGSLWQKDIIKSQKRHFLI